MKAALFLILTALFPFAVSAECACDEPFDYVTVYPKGYAANVTGAGQPDWHVISHEPIYDLRLPGEPVVGCKVLVTPVWEDHPGIDMVDLTRGYNQLWYGSRWLTFDEFEHEMEKNECQLPLA